MVIKNRLEVEIAEEVTETVEVWTKITPWNWNEIFLVILRFEMEAQERIQLVNFTSHVFSPNSQFGDEIPDEMFAYFNTHEFIDFFLNSSAEMCRNILHNTTPNASKVDNLAQLLCQDVYAEPSSLTPLVPHTNTDSSYRLNDQAIFLLAIYSVILLLSVTGNLLVLITLLQHRRMRTPTNILLLNLSASDLLLIVVCVPFTLTGSLLRDFIFGRLACHVVPYLQGMPVRNFGVCIF